MKIGIISEFSLDNVNFGNRLQAFALNKYLNNIENIKAYSLIINDRSIHRTTFIGKIKGILSVFKKKNKTNFNTSKLNKFNDFSKKNLLILDNMNKKNILKENFDLLIVGSDVVWSQFNNGIDNYKFLNFKSGNARKYSYAASFGNDWIPSENKKYLKKLLSDFSEISLRESSSVSMLENLGVKKVCHVCDPTLLISKEEWKKYEEEINIEEKYVFVYLLGKDIKQRKYITEFAKNNNYKIVNISNGDGVVDKIDEDFGDYKLDDLSIQNWLYLIDKAEYVFTDSFHGIVFSSIFEKKFFALKRVYSTNINNRIIDYLKTIDQIDKFINDEFDILNKKFTWNYNTINDNIKSFKNNSIKFLNEMLK